MCGVTLGYNLNRFKNPKYNLHTFPATEIKQDKSFLNLKAKNIRLHSGAYQLLEAPKGTPLGRGVRTKINIIGIVRLLL